MHFGLTAASQNLLLELLKRISESHFLMSQRIELFPACNDMISSVSETHVELGKIISRAKMSENISGAD